MKKILLSIAACIAIHYSYAQGDEHMQTDRPSENQTPHSVKAKYIQIETGIYIEKTSPESYTISHPVALLKYGVSDKVELRLEVKYTTLTEHYIPNDKITTGMEPVEVGFKAALCEEHSWVPQTSFIFQAGIPAMASKGFKKTHLAPQLRLAMENTLSKTISISYNAGTEWEGTETTPRWLYTFTPEINLSKHLELFVEAFGYVKQHEGAQHTLDGGFEYLFNDNLAVDIASGIGLSKASPGFFVAFGGSIRFK